ncbi:hypothetical protein AVEN_254023-1 [Araneus ventricosus]|uniref:Uncharacterized protein n=1 Tax=Araneus ventricosus TaxID=182803 RepID=A0A4Y2E5U0_ARAVE|nr:hypothetical protein AVEN_254023-1 [Araneus ventricosus]
MPHGKVRDENAKVREAATAAKRTSFPNAVEKKRLGIGSLETKGVELRVNLRGGVKKNQQYWQKSRLPKPAGVADCCWHGDSPWGSNLARGGYQFRSFFWIPFLVSGSLVIFSSPSLGVSNMAEGDGTPGATKNSGAPAGTFRIMGGSKDNTHGSSIGTPGATASSGGPTRYSFAGHQLRCISRGSSSIRRVGDGTPGTTANSGGPASQKLSLKKSLSFHHAPAILNHPGRVAKQRRTAKFLKRAKSRLELKLFFPRKANFAKPNLSG